MPASSRLRAFYAVAHGQQYLFRLRRACCVIFHATLPDAIDVAGLLMPASHMIINAGASCSFTPEGGR